MQNLHVQVVRFHTVSKSIMLFFEHWNNNCNVLEGCLKPNYNCDWKLTVKECGHMIVKQGQYGDKSSLDEICMTYMMFNLLKYM